MKQTTKKQTFGEWLFSDNMEAEITKWSLIIIVGIVGSLLVLELLYPLFN